METQADVYKPHAQAWDRTLLTRLLHWKVTCSNYFHHPTVCAFCGIFKLGSSAITDPSTSEKIPPIGTTPFYDVANARRYHCFAHGQYVSESLLEHPLIAWNDVTERIENRAFLTQALEPVLQVLMQRNSIVQRYLTVPEVPSMTHGVPMLSSSSIASIISRRIAQSPIQSMYADPMKSLMSTVCNNVDCVRSQVSAYGASKLLTTNVTSTLHTRVLDSLRTPHCYTVTAMNVTPAPHCLATTSCGTLRDHPTMSRPFVMQLMVLLTLLERIQSGTRPVSFAWLKRT